MTLRSQSTSEYYRQYYSSKKWLYKLNYEESKAKKERLAKANTDKDYYKNYYKSWIADEWKSIGETAPNSVVCNLVVCKSSPSQHEPLH